MTLFVTFEMLLETRTLKAFVILIVDTCFFFFFGSVAILQLQNHYIQMLQHHVLAKQLCQK